VGPPQEGVVADHTSIVKLSDGETLRIRGGHDDIAERLSRTTAAA
jgi:hypothetical protein